MVSQLEPVEPSGKSQDLAGLGRLGAGVYLGGAEVRAVVEDRHGGGGVVDRRHVGVGDVYGEDELGVQDWEVKLEGGEVDGDEVEGWVLGLRIEQNHRRRRRRCSDQSRAPAPFYGFAHGCARSLFFCPVNNRRSSAEVLGGRLGKRYVKCLQCPGGLVFATENRRLFVYLRHNLIFGQVSPRDDVHKLQLICSYTIIFCFIQHCFPYVII